MIWGNQKCLVSGYYDLGVLKSGPVTKKIWGLSLKGINYDLGKSKIWGIMQLLLGF